MRRRKGSNCKRSTRCQKKLALLNGRKVGRFEMYCFGWPDLRLRLVGLTCFVTTGGTM